MTKDTWAELHRLRAEAKGPDGFLTWKDAATNERLKRVAAEQAIKDARKQALEDAIAICNEDMIEGFRFRDHNEIANKIKELLK